MGDNGVHEDVYVEENLEDNVVSVKLESVPEEHVPQDEKPSQPLQKPLRRSTRIQTFPRKYDDYEIISSSIGNFSHDHEFNYSTISEPSCFEEARNCDEWNDALKKNMMPL